MNLNGATNLRIPIAWPLEELDMSTPQANQLLRDLDKKVDDIAGSSHSMAVAQATMSGEMRVLSTKLEGFEERIEPRIEALELGRSRDEWRAWAERLAFAIVGAGGLATIQRILGH